MILRRYWKLLALVLLLPLMAAAQSSPGIRTVLVFPFENASHQPGLDWMSEAFPELFGERINTDSLYLIGRADRYYAFDRMGIPLTLHASRATLYRVASELDADFVVMGSYRFEGEIFTVTAQVLDMKNLRLSPDLVESGPLNQFASIQSALAWDALQQMHPASSESKADFVQHSPVVRLNALENYIRGVLANTPAEKIRFLRAAIATDPAYARAILLLGKTYYQKGDYTQAVSWLSQVTAHNTSFAEASFFLGLSEYGLGHWGRASTAFQATAARVPLIEVWNNIGAAESRLGKQDSGSYFRKAVDADPSDPDYHFNLALTLCRRGDIPGCRRQLEETLSRNPEDDDALDLQEKLGDKLSTGPPPALPPIRIKTNYDESSYRQLSVEVRNAIDAAARKADPSERAALHRARARALLASGAFAEAENQFREALEDEPQNPSALAGLAHALLLERNFAEARLRALASLALAQGAEAYWVLARVDLQNSNSSGAGENLQKALSLEPDNPDVRKLAEELDGH